MSHRKSLSAEAVPLAASQAAALNVTDGFAFSQTLKKPPTKMCGLSQRGVWQLVRKAGLVGADICWYSRALQNRD